MSKPFVYVEYAFMFDPAETWQEMYEFDHMLDEFLETKGLEAEKINPMVPGGKAIIYIKKMDMMKQMEEASKESVLQYDPSKEKVKLRVRLPKE